MKYKDKNIMDISSESRLKKHLLFNEISPNESCYFMEKFENYELEGRILKGEGTKCSAVDLLAIHGGKSDYTSLNPILYTLQKNGIGSLSFNLSGHSSITEHISSSLQQNIVEAIKFSRNLDKVETIIGYSLGGYIALQVARILEIKKIVLFCPAIYADEALNITYGRLFTQRLKEPYSYFNSTLWEFLESFDGKLFLLFGELDGKPSVNGHSIGYFSQNGQVCYSPIPYEIKQRFRNIALKNNNVRFTEIPKVDHFLANYFKDNKNDYLYKIIVDFVIGK